MTLTLADFFCGAGGSSTGALMVPGVTLRAAANHWDRAIETHAANHPDADHIHADISQYEPSLFPRTNLGWFSPSCTKHSVAQGKRLHDAQPDLFGEVLPDAAAERSRATMWDVVRFTEYHAYEAVIVENVVEVTKWPPYGAWLAAMDSLGYDHQLVMLNSMHAQLMGDGAPQSRDRFYCVFWRKGNRRPDLHRLTRPRAVCPTCGPVRAMQSWKKPGNTIGKYRSQYVYRCPNVACRNAIVEPIVRPAADIIDWSLEGQRIGDRARPLADKTMARIQAGIDRYWAPLIIEASGNTYDAADPKHPAHGRTDGYMRAWPTNDPLRTVHTTGGKALVVPVEGREGKVARSAADPLRTATARNETGLAFLAQFRERNRLLDPHSEPLTTVVADGAGQMLVQPSDAFIAELRGGGSTVRPVADPLATVTASGNHHGLVTPYYGASKSAQTSDAPMPTVTTVERAGLATGATIDIDDVRFRMLEPREYSRAMDFPADYQMLGTRREQVRLAGNAVTPPAARDLISVVAESLGVAS
ncbi:DNA cytosine methyltransferase [Gordonia sp. PDNC005]|uniref:DNA cytosine methyltransferase n=1 Tax=Gordonia sp. PDNC005 TaxID=2811424 RepID=UPI0019639E15|nr:DNA cytosine methyltransferase [Gordonia sp. PDNC005]QRY62739.1 DNA cytosine methyltransferase [Gordonia sp. PDNC005]